MKYTILLATSLLVFACKKEQPTPEPTTEEKIIGTWKGDKVVYTENEPGQPQYQEMEDISAYNFIFNAEGTFTVDSAGFDVENYQWSVSGNDDFIWRYDANSADVLTIIQLNNNSFTLQETGTYINSNNVVVPYTDEIKLVR